MLTARRLHEKRLQEAAGLPDPPPRAPDFVSFLEHEAKLRDLTKAHAAELAAARGKPGSGAARASGDVILEAAGAGAPRAKAKAGAKPKATASPTKATPSASALPKELDFLKDARLSPQEKVFRFLLYLQDKADRELEAKLREMGPKTSTPGIAASQNRGSTIKRAGRRCRQA